MAEERRAPLTTFLIALCHDPKMLEDFWSGNLSAQGTGLTQDELASLRTSTLEKIQDDVRKEQSAGSADAEAIYAGIWIKIPRWIFGTSGDESSDEPYEKPSDEPPYEPSHEPES